MEESCSARLVRHSLESISIPIAHREYIPSAFWSVDPDARVALSNAHAPMVAAAEDLRDDELGLKLGSALHFGAGGVFDYAVHSAATLRDSIEVARRFGRLVADSLCVSFETYRDQAIVRLDLDPTWPRVVADFATSAWFKVHLCGQFATDARVQCWFPYPAPKDAGVHEKTLTGAALRFGAPLLGFALQRDFAAAPMPAADPVLHSIHCERAASMLAGLSDPEEMSAVVRRIIDRELERGSTTASQVASALHMSRSTMTRRLLGEGTDFSAQIDRVRRDRALRFMRAPNASLTEVAFRSGFAHVESFHRAFKRWTGHCPSAYRKRLSSDVGARQNAKRAREPGDSFI